MGSSWLNTVPCAVFKTAQGTGRLLWEDDKDAEGKEEEEKARSRDRVPKGSPGTGLKRAFKGQGPVKRPGLQGAVMEQGQASAFVRQRAVLSGPRESVPASGRAAQGLELFPCGIGDAVHLCKACPNRTGSV